MKFLSIAFQVLLLASFAMWFGGFGFYASFVVPVGNDVLGSFEQAQVTRQVTVWLNWLGVLAGVLMMASSISQWKSTHAPRKQIQFVAAVLMLVMQAWLFWLHPQIDAYVDLQLHEIKGDYEQFYWLHRVYLWASTVQWIAAWLWLICYAMGWRHRMSTDA